MLRRQFTIWTKSAGEILEKVARAKQVLDHNTSEPLTAFSLSPEIKVI